MNTPPTRSQATSPAPTGSGAAKSAATKDQILDAAERLLAQRGYAGTSLRAITAAADVNLAAVNYHFGSKEALAKAVFTRRLAPINRVRIERLDALPADHSLTDILRAFLGPVIEGIEEMGDAAEAVKQLMGRIFAERPGFLRELMVEQFGEILARFPSALAAKLPGLSRAELMWRFHFVVGAMAHTMCHAGDLSALSEGHCSSSDGRALLHNLVSFAAAGLSAPSSDPTPS